MYWLILTVSTLVNPTPCPPCRCASRAVSCRASKPFPRRDVAWKVFGTGSYITDVSVPGMLHARVIRTPHAGSVPEKVDQRSIRAVKEAPLLGNTDNVTFERFAHG